MPLLSSATGRCFAAFIGHGIGAERARRMMDEEMARAREAGRSDLPQRPDELQALIRETRAQGLGRVNNVLLPGISGFCAPVFDADGHLALGVVALGSTATFDTAWDGPLAKALRAMAGQLSADLGWRGQGPAGAADA